MIVSDIETFLSLLLLERGLSRNTGTGYGQDLRRFADKGYAAQKAVAVDMFPRTRHVETAVLLSKAER